MMRFEARIAVLEALKKMVSSFCSRSNFSRDYIVESNQTRCVLDFALDPRI